MNLNGIALVGGTTLLGRELSEMLAETSTVTDLKLLHGRIEEEGHDIIEIAGQAALATSIETGDLDGIELVIVLDELEGPSLRRLGQALNDGVQLLVANGDFAADLDLEVLVHGALPDRLAHRLPAPELSAVAMVTELFEPDLEHLTIFAQRPASNKGDLGIEDLAKAVTARLSGQSSASGDAPAFDIRLVDDPLVEVDAATMFPSLDPLIKVVDGACFHGHWVQIGIGLSRSLQRQEVFELLQASDRLVMSEGSLHLLSVADSNAIHVSQPSVSNDGRRIALDIAFDGLRVGGANLILELMERWR